MTLQIKLKEIEYDLNEVDESQLYELPPRRMVIHLDYLSLPSEEELHDDICDHICDRTGWFVEGFVIESISTNSTVGVFFTRLAPIIVKGAGLLDILYNAPRGNMRWTEDKEKYDKPTMRRAWFGEQQLYDAAQVFGGGN
jgi:hypothetical protein